MDLNENETQESHEPRFCSTTVDRTIRAPATTSKLPNAAPTPGGLTTSNQTKFSLIKPNNNPYVSAIGPQSTLRPLQRLQLAASHPNPYNALANTATVNPNGSNSVSQPQAKPRIGLQTGGANGGVSLAGSQQSVRLRPSGLARPITPIKSTAEHQAAKSQASSTNTTTKKAPPVASKLVAPISCTNRANLRVSSVGPVQAQARLKPAVSVSRLPTSTSAALSSASSNSHLAAHQTGNGTLKAILKPTISSATISRGPITSPAVSVTSRQAQPSKMPLAAQREHLASSSNYQHQATGLPSNQHVKTSPINRVVPSQKKPHSPPFSPAPVGSCSQPVSFKVTNGCVNIDISLVHNEVHQIRQTLEHLVEILQSAQRDKENLERENELLKMRLRAIELESAASSGADSGEPAARKVTNKDKEIRLDADSPPATETPRQQLRGETFISEQRANKNEEQQQTGGPRASVYFSPMN